jgi:hypothetical protein
MFHTATNGDSGAEKLADRADRDGATVNTGIKLLKRGRRSSNSMSVIGKLVRVLFAVLIATALIGAPAVQAAIAVPCGATTVTGMTDQRLAGHSQAPTPCKEKMPGCAGMLGCGVNVSLGVRVALATNDQVWMPTVYWPIAGSLDGLVVKPDLGPPITV